MFSKTKYSIGGLTETEINSEFERLASIKMKAMTYIRTPVFITLDLSGSMKRHYAILKDIVKIMNNELRVVPKRDFTLFIQGIYNSKPLLLYFGDLHAFDFDSFMASLPDECNGGTPLAKSFIKADTLLSRFNKTCEDNNHWYTIPVFFSVTDCAATDSADDCNSVAEKFKKDVADNNKLVVEFVTCANPDGLSLGGYKIQIDGNPEKIATFMQGLRLATSTEADLENASISRIPSKQRDRVAYNRYMSDIMLFNIKFCYDRVH